MRETLDIHDLQQALTQFTPSTPHAPSLMSRPLPLTTSVRETLDLQQATFGSEGNLGSQLYIKDVDYTKVDVQVAIQKLQVGTYLKF